MSTPESSAAATSESNTPLQPASSLVTPTSRRSVLRAGLGLSLGAGSLALGATRTRRTYARQASGTEITISTQNFSQDPFKPFTDEFTAQTGVKVNFFSNPSAGGDQVAQLTPQFAASTTPVDVLSCSDEVAPQFIRAGWLEPLNDIATEEFWSDWDQSVRDYVNIWSTVDGKVYRIPHGWSVGFYWTRQDYLDQLGLQAPATWDDLRTLGDAAKAKGWYAFADAASIPSLAFVYAAYLVAQSGGNIFDFDDGTRTAFEFGREMVDKEWFPRSAANWTYDQLNAAYTGDQLVTMREWPFFYDVARGDTAWFAEEKVVVQLPPAGPSGKRATWAGAWGWTVPKFTEKKDAAFEFVKFITSPEQSGPIAKAMSDYTVPRKSCFDVVGGQGVAKYIQDYTAAGVITPRPFHPRVSEAQAIVDTQFNGYLTGQVSLDDAMKNGSRDIKGLEEE